MRHFLPLALLLATPLRAEVFTLEAPVHAVTLHPDGAAVQRLLTVDLPPGTHELRVIGLPAGLDGGTLSLHPGPGLRLGSTSLFADRQPPGTAKRPPEVEAAEAEVKSRQAALRAKDAEIAQIRAGAEAARAEAAAIQALAGGAEGPLDPGSLQALANAAGAGTKAALERAAAAEAEAREAEVAREDLVKDLEKAEAAFAALSPPREAGAVLTLAVESQGGAGAITLETLTAEAAWAPSYDLNLVTEGPPALDLTRALRLWQNSGEDWRDVELTLSTGAALRDNSARRLYPRLAEILDAGPLGPALNMEGEGGPVVVVDEPASAVETGEFDFPRMRPQGLVMTYVYPKPITLLAGAGETQLPLDQLSLTPEVFALAIPLNDENAYVTAKVTNTGGELLLPGPARFYRDGALIGSGDLPLWPQGVEQELGFGPLESLMLSRKIPDRSEGDSGFFSSDTEQREEVQITAENHGSRAWPLRLRDRVPYSEQDDLEITYEATPPETTRDLDGVRGILEWQMDLAPAAKAEIVLRTTLRWPEGMVLLDRY